MTKNKIRTREKLTVEKGKRKRSLDLNYPYEPNSTIKPAIDHWYYENLF